MLSLKRAVPLAPAAGVVSLTHPSIARIARAGAVYLIRTPED